MIEDWFKTRGYLHFDTPISYRAAKRLVTSKSFVSTYSFWPFIRKTKTVKRYKPEEKDVVKKVRELGYCAHIDGHIYSYYAKALNNIYEEKIKSLGISDSILAYRKHPGKKCNIDFANEVFELIRTKGECDVIALDIKGFFDNMSHYLLRGAWSYILGVQKLPDDHYSVFKAITKYSWINKKDVYGFFHPHGGSKRICNPDEFRTKLAANGLINRNKNPFGIPQGSPMSAFLSNLYMLDFDQKAVGFANKYHCCPK
jgi:hypothetical protein